MSQSKTPGESPRGDLRDIEPREGDEVGGELGRPSNPDARDQCRLGDLYFKSMIYEYAADAYKRAIHFDLNYAMAHHNLGAVYYKMGLFAEAMEELKVAIKLRPDVPRFHYTLGLLLKDDKKPSEAIASFSEAISLAPDYVRAYYRRGFAYFYGGDLEKACSDLEEVVKLDPGLRDALYNLGVIYISQGRWDDAREAFLRHLALRSTDPDALYYMGLIHVGSRGDSEQAIESFQKAVDLDPGHLKARFQLSLLHARKRYREPSHRQEAIMHFRSLIEMYEEVGDFDRIHDAFFILGSVYDDDPDDAELAIEAYKSGLRLAAWSAEAHNNLGVLYSQKGSVDEAVKEFREAIRLDPDYESPYRNLAKIYFYQRNEEIAKDFQQWVDEVPEICAKILFNLSLALMDVGRAEACESIYSRAHRIKNLIGVAGSKLRRISREMNGDKGEQLIPVLADQEKCYNEMVSLLGTLKQDDLLLDMVDVNATIETVLHQADFESDGQPDRGMLRLSSEDSASVECRIDLAENLPRVKGDPRKLKEALNNIIINALEAMGDGGYLRIITRYSPSASLLQPGGMEGGGVEILLQDTGTGISADDLDNIFKPGYTTKESGSGFGLSIVDRIIKEHKGSVHISSRKGGGTEVKIYLPVNLESEPIQTGLRMRPVIYEDPSELISTEVDQIVGI
jgi:tetratricopeptide (TPR) repeat protein